MIFKAPMDGLLRPLNSVPDQAFSNGLLGEGVAIDPLIGEVCAPIDAIVKSIAPTLHSIILADQAGIEILIHVGLETVSLRGKGFISHVNIGDKVKCGQKLLSFDLDIVASGAKSLLTPIIILENGGRKIKFAKAGVINKGDFLFEVENYGNSLSISTFAENDSENQIRQSLKIALEHGIHARPASEIARIVKKHQVEVNILCKDREASGQSVVSLIALNAEHNDKIELIVKGENRQIAADELILFLNRKENIESHATSILAEAFDNTKQNLDSKFIYGVRASAGYACAKAIVKKSDDKIIETKGNGNDFELNALEGAISTISNELNSTLKNNNQTAKSIAGAHLEILEDPSILSKAINGIENGKSAASAWQFASRENEATLRSSTSPRVQERASDLRDLENRILRALGVLNQDVLEIPKGEDVILLADDLLPSQFLDLPHDRIKGICTKGGGSTSHVSILAASFGIPMLVAVGPRLDEINNGDKIILNADQSFIDPKPNSQELQQAEVKIAKIAKSQKSQIEDAQNDCFMADGTRIEVFANIATIEEAMKASQMGAEGCGLLRTEFLFLDRDNEPDEIEQIKALSEIANALKNKDLVVRTLDIGGDKPISYFPFPLEENPALGMRGIRFQLENPEVLKRQVRAILQAVPTENCKIMLPMIIDLDEFRAARNIINQAATELGLIKGPSIGIMIETPSAAIMADSLAKETDFFSVGSNDLTQYTLAMDRTNSKLASRADGLHPAVLNLIAKAAQSANSNGKWIGVCGGIASIPSAVPILIGLGISELSVTVSAIPKIKSIITKLNMSDCKAIAKKALLATNIDEVKKIIIEAGYDNV